MSACNKMMGHTFLSLGELAYCVLPVQGSNIEYTRSIREHGQVTIQVSVMVSVWVKKSHLFPKLNKINTCTTVNKHFLNYFSFPWSCSLKTLVIY